MFDNAGEKLKVVAGVFTAIGFVGSVIGGIAIWISGLILLGLLTIAGGIFFSWVSGLALYCIGEAADNRSVVYHTAPSTPKPSYLTQAAAKSTSTYAGKKCPNCGKPVSPYDAKCNYCEHKLN